MTELIAFEVLGEGEAVVLIHGDFANGRLAWSRQVERFAGQFKLIVVDRRGNGRSPRAPMYTIAGDACDVLDVTNWAEVDSFHLVGHSYGAIVALEIARRVPASILSLHLIEPPLASLLPKDPDVATLMDRTAQLFGNATHREPEAIASEFFAVVAGADGLARLRARPAWSRLVAEAERLCHAESPGNYPADAMHELKIVAPIRVYTGGRSHPGLRKLARRLVDVLPGAALVDVPEAAHDVQRTADAFNAAFLAAVRPQMPPRL